MPTDSRPLLHLLAGRTSARPRRRHLGRGLEPAIEQLEQRSLLSVDPLALPAENQEPEESTSPPIVCGFGFVPLCPLPDPGVSPSGDETGSTDPEVVSPPTIESGGARLEADDLNVSGREGEPIAGRLTGRQLWDPIVPGFLFEVSPPVVGTLVVDPFSGSFAYTPPANFVGTVTFSYQAWDGEFSKPATVTIVIEPSAEDEAWATVEPPVAEPADEPAAQQTEPTAEEPSPDVFTSLTLFRSPEASGDGWAAAVVIVSTDDLDARQLAVESLLLSANDAGPVPEETAVSRYRYEDVNGDGRDDLIALFQLDWTALWDGMALATLSGDFV